MRTTNESKTIAKKRKSDEKPNSSSNNKRLLCEICTENRRIREMDGEVLTEIQKTYFDTSHLIRHKRVAHNIGKKLECEYCKKSFYQNQDLKKHTNVCVTQVKIMRKCMMYQMLLKHVLQHKSF